ncbi:MAG: hypothetical protein AAFP87_14650 [Pseudomonadota bacterium]
MTPYLLSVAFAGGLASATSAFEVDLIDVFFDTRAKQIEHQRFTGVNAHVSMTTSQREQLSILLSPDAVPEAVMVPSTADWFQLQSTVDKPEVCQFVSFRADHIALAEGWNDYISVAQPELRMQAPALVVAGNAVRAGGFASRPINDGFLQASFSSFDAGGATLSILSAVETGQSPASCDLWPEECD